LIEGGDGAEPSAFVVRRMQLEYLKPARIDDVLEVETRVAEVKGAALRLAQRLVRDGAVLFETDVLVVLVSVSGKPQRLSQRLRAGLAGN
jgi:acyl-CoA thioester hydrolase